MTEQFSVALDRDVYRHLLQTAMETGRVPQGGDIAAGLGRPPEEVDGSLRRLAEGRVIVLSPARHATRVWMANPFSAVPTPFHAHAGERSYWGNCVWDALGIVALTGGTGRVTTGCGDCGEPMSLEIRDRWLVHGEGVVHFGVPAREWWDNIGFT